MENGEATEQPEQLQPNDKRLDFTSPEFDPLIALQTPGLQPPVPDAPLLDNVSKCASLALGPDVSQQQAAATASMSEEERAKREQEQQAKKAKAAALKQRAQKAAQRAEAGVRTQTLATIMSTASKGPLAALAKWQASGQKVLVVTRHAAGVRGKAVGLIRAFDRFMNLVLADVEESYTVIIKVPRVKQQELQQQSSAVVERRGDSPQQHQQQLDEQQQCLQQQQQQIAEIMGLPAPPPPQQQQQQQPHSAEMRDQQQEQQQQQQVATTRTRVRWCRKQEHRFRKLDQVLLRGDSIVLISSQTVALGLKSTVDTSGMG